MSAVEELIGKIISKNPHLSREAIIERLETEKTRTAGFFSDEILLQMIAASFGVEVAHEAKKPKLLSMSLVPSLGDVTVTGRIVAVFPATEKTGKGKVASLLAADESGIIRIVLWNDKVAFAEPGKLRVGQIARFHHGYTKEDRYGKVELHIGERGEVEVEPSDVKPEDYPTVEKFSTKIGKISSSLKNKRIHIIGKVEDAYPPSTFKREDSSVGKVMRFIVADETGRIPVVVWNEKADEIEGLIKRSVKVQIVNCKVKKALDEGLEVHIDSSTYTSIIKPSEETLKINCLKEGLLKVNVEGKVATKPINREVKTSRGEKVKLTVFEIEDETGRIWVSAWRENAEKTANLNAGDKISIKNAYVKKGFADQLEISTRNATIIELHKTAEP